IVSAANGIGTPSWQQAIPHGASGSPAPRADPSAVYDQRSNRMIVFGGDNNTFGAYNDVWILMNADGTGGTPAWLELSPANPPPARTVHTAAYDPATNRMIVFAGQSSPHSPATVFNDVWVLTNANGTEANPPAWIQLS